MTMVGKKGNVDERLKQIKFWIIGMERLVKGGESCLQSRAGRSNTWNLCIKTGEVTGSITTFSSFSTQQQPGYLKISRVYPTGSMGREVCTGLVVEGDGRSLESQEEFGWLWRQ